MESTNGNQILWYDTLFSVGALNDFNNLGTTKRKGGLINLHSI
jgi:hypothetical protein